MEEAFHLFEHGLSEIGDILISAFQLDINDVGSIKSALLILFPPTPPSDWERPGVRAIVTRLNQLIDLGFKLTDTVIEEVFHIFEHRL
ncbi:hypothetical protein RhiirA5_412664 [Rhizophagus irregularis]|uniref:Uncharacterized protein n=1 Tax=Rhizophagus irregularis TaxID=588596 RepID=A0A2I1ENH9_9GLOM|nr:hypothetical protein RhiirA5_412664 [Rhizophagus irregularis]PKY23691.1 hypothetical protein RhiirB3_437972 [Rhizophagus irregularis]CAB5094772.1 unnamed protein product [Rhizophagus irregularis]CAB5386877.1 unnamed protein product [Rhizophagus irregularis]